MGRQDAKHFPVTVQDSVRETEEGESDELRGGIDLELSLHVAASGKRRPWDEERLVGEFALLYLKEEMSFVLFRASIFTGTILGHALRCSGINRCGGAFRKGTLVLLSKSEKSERERLLCVVFFVFFFFLFFLQCAFVKPFSFVFTNTSNIPKI